MKEVDPNLPVDKIAALVVSKSNHQSSDFKLNQRISSMTPLPMVPWFGPRKDDMTGRKCGRYTVVGCALYRPNDTKKNSVRWVVRCTCGRYEMIATRTVKKNHPKLMCVECGKVNRLKEMASN